MLKSLPFDLECRGDQALLDRPRREAQVNRADLGMSRHCSQQSANPRENLLLDRRRIWFVKSHALVLPKATPLLAIKDDQRSRERSALSDDGDLLEKRVSHNFGFDKIRIQLFTG